MPSHEQPGTHGLGSAAVRAVGTPHQLVVLLFQGARAALVLGRRAIERKEPERAGDALAKAMAIIDDGLNAGLDMENGGLVAQRLRALYNYMIGRLHEARRAQEAAPVAEVEGLLAGLEESWRQIAKDGTA